MLTLRDDKVLACIRQGLFLIREGDQRLAVLVREEDKIGSREDIVVEAMALDRAAAERCLHDLRRAMRSDNVYRGHVISLREENFRELKVVFHRLSNIDRDSIILPEGLLSRIHMSDVQRNWEKIKTGPNKKKQGQP